MSEDPGASRRALLGSVGAALAGSSAIALGGCGRRAKTGHRAVKQVARSVRRRDVEILRRALEIERRTVAAYIAGIPLLSRPQARAARQFLNQELLHTGELLSLIKAAGGKAAPRASSYQLGHPGDGTEVLQLLHSLEALQIANYLDEPVARPGASRGFVDPGQRRAAHLDPAPGPGPARSAIGFRDRKRVMGSVREGRTRRPAAASRPTRPRTSWTRAFGMALLCASPNK